jgi:hypothetical protein
MSKIISTSWILKHRASNRCKVFLSFCVIWTSMNTWTTLNWWWANVSIISRLLSEENSSSCWWDRVQSLFRNSTSWYTHCFLDSWSSNCWQILPIIAPWSWYFTHFLHLFHIRKSLSSRRKSISRIFPQILFLTTTWLLIQKRLVHSVNRKPLRVLATFLEGKTKGWLCHILIWLVKFCSSCLV